MFAGHGVPLFYCHVGRVWLCGYGFWQGFRQVEGRESEWEKHFQKSSSSLPLHTQGRRRTVPFKMALFRLFFIYIRKEKCNLEEPKNRLWHMFNILNSFWRACRCARCIYVVLWYFCFREFQKLLVVSLFKIISKIDRFMTCKVNSSPLYP